MRARWVLCLVLAGLGVGIGLAASTLHQTQTTAEARLAVGSQSLSAYQVAGFAVASQALASNYARFVSDSSSASMALQEALGADVGKIVGVDASPIPDSNVIRVQVTASSPEAAVLAAQTIADDLREQANGAGDPTAEMLLEEHETMSGKVAAQQFKVDRLKTRLAGLDPGDREAKIEVQRDLQQAQAHLSTLSLRQNATGVAYQQTLTQPDVDSELRDVQPAAVISDDARRTQQLYAVSGLFAGLLSGLALANILGPKRVSRRSRSRARGQELDLSAAATQRAS